MNRPLLFVAGALLLGIGLLARAGAQAPLPQHLRDTGWSPNVRSYAPQYPLWSDGADKRRWLVLPPGASIDASQPDAWVFPPGTKLWKEFSHEGRRVETRYIERGTDGRWRYATYVWNERGDDALLAPAEGARASLVPEAPGGRYDIPAQADCRACHEGTAVPVLGFSALQLSSELRALVAQGVLRGLPAPMLEDPPRIAATSPVERAALGYLHANCGHCHNDSAGAAPARLRLAQSAVADAATRDALRATFMAATSRYRLPGAVGDTLIVAPGRAGTSLIALRMRSRAPRMQMPPLGTRVPDVEGIALIERWIENLDPVSLSSISSSTAHPEHSP